MGFEQLTEARTVVSELSPIFLPISLFIQSSPELDDPDLDCRPGTTRGMAAAVLLK